MQIGCTITPVWLENNMNLAQLHLNKEYNTLSSMPVCRWYLKVTESVLVVVSRVSYTTYASK